MGEPGREDEHSFEDKMPSLVAVTADQMREVDRLVAYQYGIQVVQLLESAGRALARIARSLLDGKVLKRKIIVLAGSGKNAAGGMAAARNLHNWGANVMVALATHEDALKRSAMNQLNILKSMDLSIEEASGLSVARLRNIDLIIDALLGYGAQGAPSAEFASVIDLANKSKKPILSLDIPSGMDATTGQVYDSVIRATATLTIAYPKTGLVMDESAKYIGDLWLADVGIPPETFAKAGLEIENPFIEEDVVLVSRKGKAISITA